MSGERTIGPIDTVWLNMDRPDNLMVIDIVVWFDEPVDWERFAEVARLRLVERYPVFTQRPVPPTTPLGLPHWEDDPGFDLDRHLHRVTLPAPGDRLALQRYVEEQMPTPLPRDRPLWEAHLVDGFGDGSAVVLRLHHALADGIALGRVALSLTDEEPDADLRVDDEAQWRSRHDRHGLGGSVGAAVSGAGALARGGLHVLGDLPHLAVPSHALDALAQVISTARIANKVFLGSTPQSPLTGAPGVAKRALICQPRELDAVKQVARLSGATVNDVLVAAVAGAVRRYVVDHGGEPVDLTAMVPVNIRPLDQPLPRELGNQFALVLLSLPVAVAAPLQRLAEAKRRMDTIKHSPEAVLTFGLLTTIGRTTPDIERRLVDFFSAKAFGVLTNVPGPTAPRYMAGTRIAGILGWVPSSGRHAVGVSIFSYDGSVLVGFKTDATVVPDPEALEAAFAAEMDDLETLVRK